LAKLSGAEALMNFKSPLGGDLNFFGVLSNSPSKNMFPTKNSFQVKNVFALSGHFSEYVRNYNAIIKDVLSLVFLKSFSMAFILPHTFERKNQVQNLFSIYLNLMPSDTFIFENEGINKTPDVLRTKRLPNLDNQNCKIINSFFLNNLVYKQFMGNGAFSFKDTTRGFINQFYIWFLSYKANNDITIKQLKNNRFFKKSIQTSRIYEFQ